MRDFPAELSGHDVIWNQETTNWLQELSRQLTIPTNSKVLVRTGLSNTLVYVVTATSTDFPARSPTECS